MRGGSGCVPRGSPGARSPGGAAGASSACVRRRLSFDEAVDAHSLVPAHSYPLESIVVALRALYQRQVSFERQSGKWHAAQLWHAQSVSTALRSLHEQVSECSWAVTQVCNVIREHSTRLGALEDAASAVSYRVDSLQHRHDSLETQVAQQSSSLDAYAARIRELEVVSTANGVLRVATALAATYIVAKRLAGPLLRAGRVARSRRRLALLRAILTLSIYVALARVRTTSVLKGAWTTLRFLSRAELPQLSALLR